MNLQLCSLVSLQRYKKALSVHQRIQMVKKSSLKPEKLLQVLKDVSQEQLNIVTPSMIYYWYVEQMLKFRFCLGTEMQWL